MCFFCQVLKEYGAMSEQYRPDEWRIGDPSSLFRVGPVLLLLLLKPRTTHTDRLISKIHLTFPAQPPLLLVSTPGHVVAHAAI